MVPSASDGSVGSPLSIAGEPHWRWKSPVPGLTKSGFWSRFPVPAWPPSTVEYVISAEPDKTSIAVPVFAQKILLETLTPEPPATAIPPPCPEDALFTTKVERLTDGFEKLFTYMAAPWLAVLS